MSNNSIGFSANNGILKPLLDAGFLAHTNTNGNTPVGSVDDYDVLAFQQVKEACKQFEEKLGAVVVNGASVDVANGSIAQISDLTILNTIAPTQSFTSLPAADLSAISYISKVGIMALKISGAVTSGTTGSLLFSTWSPILSNSQYELYIKYFSSVVGSNIGIKFDMTGVTPLSGDTAVAYRVIGLQEVVSDTVNDTIVVTADGLITIQGVDAPVSEVIETVNTTVYNIRIAA